MILRTPWINPEQYTQLLCLEEACHQPDRSTIPFYPHLITRTRPLPESLLYYENQQLAGVAIAFFFEPLAAEISLCVHPSYRRQGIGSLLFHQLMNDIQRYRTISTVWVTKPSHSFKLTEPWIYDHTEHTLELNLKTSESPWLDHGTHNTLIRKALLTDSEALSQIDTLCFNALEHINLQEILSDPQKTMLVLIQNDQLIGKALLSLNDKQITKLSDFAIHPSHQRQGLGKYLLQGCIETTIQQKSSVMILHVKQYNKFALKLYQSFKFESINTIDYWKCRL